MVVCDPSPEGLLQMPPPETALELLLKRAPPISSPVKVAMPAAVVVGKIGGDRDIRQGASRRGWRGSAALEEHATAGSIDTRIGGVYARLCPIAHERRARSRESHCGESYEDAAAPCSGVELSETAPPLMVSVPVPPPAEFSAQMPPPAPH